MRICSLLPGATEVVAALGLRDQLVGISHECDYPPGLSAPVIVEPAIRSEDALTSDEIDRRVRDAVQQGDRLYKLSESALVAARPDLIILQDLCDVCAVVPSQLEEALLSLTPRPRVLKLHPRTLEDVFADILRIGCEVARGPEAKRLVDNLRQTVAAVRHRVASSLIRPRVACLEWLSPLYIAGHWVPDMVDIAGGTAVLTESGAPSRRITWDELTAASAEVIIVLPCGFSKERAGAEWERVAAEPEWRDFPAVRQGHVHVVDALAYFSRPGPRLVEGVSQLSACFHPTLSHAVR
jgi:iron complex transport system substrate-binding protein